MSDAKTSMLEETFAFPKYAAFSHEGGNKAYAMGFVRQLHEAQEVLVRVGPGRYDQAVVYEYETETSIVQAVLLRSAWLRPVESLDKIHPVKIQVLIDESVVFEQSIGEHVKPPTTTRSCACNSWARNVECQCWTAPITPTKAWPFNAVAVDEKRQATPDLVYGIFLPTQSLVQIRIVNPWRGAIEFQARCGITAALYSTKESDIAV